MQRISARLAVRSDLHDGLLVRHKLLRHVGTITAISYQWWSDKSVYVEFSGPAFPLSDWFPWRAIEPASNTESP